MGLWLSCGQVGLHRVQIPSSSIHCFTVSGRGERGREREIVSLCAHVSHFYFSVSCVFVLFFFYSSLLSSFYCFFVSLCLSLLPLNMSTDNVSVHSVRDLFVHNLLISRKKSGAVVPCIVVWRFNSIKSFMSRLNMKWKMPCYKTGYEGNKIIMRPAWKITNLS